MGIRPGKARASAGIVALLALCLVLAGGVRAATSIKHPDGPDPAVSAWPEWPYPTLCEGLQFDPVAAFRGPTDAQLGTGAPEQALRRHIDERLYVQTPTKYWRVVAASETRVEFASGLLSVDPFWLAFELRGEEWKAVGYARSCTLRTVRDGRPAVQWRLAPGQRLGPRTKRIRLRLFGGGCHGKTPLVDLAGKPAFWGTGRKLVIGVWLDKLGPGPHTCPKPREDEFLSIELPGRLGERRLYDGRTYPPDPRSSRLRQ